MTSSAPLRDSDDIAAAFERLIATPHLSTLVSALGSVADLHLVGGIVRDTILNVNSDKVDIDLATRLTPELLTESLQAANIRVVETGIKHGTITALVNAVPVEITTFRASGAHESNEYSECITTDLAARDFTINAIAYSINSHRLIDPHNGLADLYSHVLKALPEPADRFIEDPLRIMRMVRFGMAAGRDVDEGTWRAGLDNRALLNSVSIERVREEFTKILLSTDAATGVRALLQLDLLEQIIPEIIECIGFEQNQFHIHDVFEHTLWVLERTAPSALQRLTALFHDLGKPATLTVGEDGSRHFYRHEILSSEICDRAMSDLRYSRKLTRAVSTLVRYHMRPLDCGPAGIRRLMRDLDDLLEEWLAFKVADAPPLLSEEEFRAMYDLFCDRLQIERERLNNSAFSLAINGDDLIELGLQPGKTIGTILKRLEDAVMEDPDLNLRETLLGMARKQIALIS